MYYKKVLKPKNAIKKSFDVSSNTTNTEYYENGKSDDLDDDLRLGSLKVTNTLRHRILTTRGDDNIKYGLH